MRWYKQFTDHHRGQTIQALFNRMGHTGPCCYYFIMEMCAEKLECDYENKEQIFRFHEQLVRRNLHISSEKLKKFLGICSEFSVLSFNFSGEFLEIKMPNLFNLLNRDIKKPRQKRANTAEKSRLDIDIDIDKEEDKEYKEKMVKKKNAVAKTQPPPGEKVNDLISFYCDAWKSAYNLNTNPIISGKDVGLIKGLAKNINFTKTKEIIESYLKMPDQWFLKKRHDIPTMITNLNAIIHFAETGKILTKNDIFEIERKVDSECSVIEFNRIQDEKERLLLNDKG